MSLREIADRVPGYPDTHGAPVKRSSGTSDCSVTKVCRYWSFRSTVRTNWDTESTPTRTTCPTSDSEPEEQAALNLAVAGVHLGEPIGRDALLKLGAGGESIVRSEAAPLVDLRSIDGLPALSVLFDAVRQRAAVRFDYRGDERHVGVAGLRFRKATGTYRIRP